MAADTKVGSIRSNFSWRIAGWGGAAFLLLLPLIARAPWTASDFVFAALLLGSVGIGLEFAFRSTNNFYRMAAGTALASAFLLIWISGAVGIIGTEREEMNILFLGVLVLALLGAMAARFRPRGMAVAMSAAGIAQMLVPLIAWQSAGPVAGSAKVIALTAGFTGMWLLSAWLFRKAAK